MPDEKPSFVKAMVNFFGEPKLKPEDFKSLTTEDKLQLSEMLQPFMPHTPYSPPTS